ncbi:MAG: hypothetical protein M1821_008236 [Bathelium mastoideum]|nr:MAG: hypothetical protein M1821_008236 [Bathelium mastoideum]
MASGHHPLDEAALDNLDRRRAVRTLPAYVRTFDEEDARWLRQHESADPHASAAANAKEVPRLNAPRGRRFDHLREREPVIITQPMQASAPMWRSFMRATALPSTEPGERVSQQWLRQHMPDADGGLATVQQQAAEEEKMKKPLLKRMEQWPAVIRHTVLRNPFIPLIFRLIVLACSTAALGLGVTLLNLVRSVHCEWRPTSSLMAIIVDSIAIPYLLYVTWDEYTSKPLGLRRPAAKIRLIFLDLYFIIFDSANLTLAFLALTTEQETCLVGETEGDPFHHAIDKDVRARKKSLSGVLLVALVAWVLTFSVSVFRVIERVSGR